MMPTLILEVNMAAIVSMVHASILASPSEVMNRSFTQSA